MPEGFCCQEHADEFARAADALAAARAAREAVPSTMDEPDYYDAMKAERLAREEIPKHAKVLAGEAAMRKALAAADAYRERIKALEARLSSRALDFAMKTMADDPDAAEPANLIDDPARIKDYFIEECIFDLYAETGHWPTMDATATRLASEMGATFVAARQGVADNVQGAYTAAQTVVLVRRGEAVSEGPEDVWRLVVRDHAAPRLAADRAVGVLWDELVDGWRIQLSETLDW